MLAHFWAKLKDAQLSSDGKVLELVDDTSFLGMENSEESLWSGTATRSLRNRLRAISAVGRSAESSWGLQVPYMKWGACARFSSFTSRRCRRLG